MPARPSRSASRGRPAKTPKSPKSPKSPKTPKSPAAKSPGRPKGRKAAVTTPKKAAAAPAVNKMDFDEGEQVMARWPGTALYFKAKVTYVREDDNEYDVQYEDGTVFTIKAKEVKAFKAAATAKKTTPSRSRSRGRSPGRPARKSIASPAAKSPARKAPGASPARKAPDTATRTSARIAASKIELSSDEEGAKKRRSLSNPSSFFANLSFGWVQSLFVMIIGPLIGLCLMNLCAGKTCKLAVPNLSRNWRDYYNQKALLQLLGFGMTIKTLSFVLGRVRALSGRIGFLTLVAILAVLPALKYRKISLSFVSDNFYGYFTSSLILAFVNAVAGFILSRWGKRSQINPKGNTGNVVVDFVNGREYNPSMFGMDFKLVTFRASMCGQALLSAALVVANIEAKNGAINPAVVLSGAFQILYAMDAMFFEDDYMYSHDNMNCGYGFNLISSYAMFPFINTLVTRYVIAQYPAVPTTQLVVIGLMNAFGYVIFRSSENQRCEFIRSPNSAASKALQSIPAAGGRKVLVAGWRAVVRYPNYLGEVLIQWSWALPAAKIAASSDLLIYYLPVFTTLMLAQRVCGENAKNKRKYGAAWNNYCERVKSNLIPYIY